MAKAADIIRKTPDRDKEPEAFDNEKTYVGDVAKGRSVGGRPPAFKTAAELEARIDDYFNYAVPYRQVVIKKGNFTDVKEIPVPTISGLALHLGFNSRQSFYNYEGKPEFMDTIKKARFFIEQHYEEMLQTGNTTGAIFALKNFGWRDTVDLTSNGEKLPMALVQFVGGNDATSRKAD